MMRWVESLLLLLLLTPCLQHPPLNGGGGGKIAFDLAEIRSMGSASKSKQLGAFTSLRSAGVALTGGVNKLCSFFGTNSDCATVPSMVRMYDHLVSEFCCTTEVPTTLPSLKQGREGSEMWPTSENGVTKSAIGEGDGTGIRTSSQSTTATSNSSESGDDEDILGLISSSLDRFNAQLHRNSQISPPIPVCSHMNRSEIPVQDMGLGIPSNFSNSMLSTWASFATSTKSQGQGVPGSLGYSSFSSNGPVGLSSSVMLQQKSMPSPPGLPRLSQQQQQPTNGILKTLCLDGLPTRKQRSVSQTFSDSDEVSSRWESQWKALPPEIIYDRKSIQIFPGSKNDFSIASLQLTRIFCCCYLKERLFTRLFFSRGAMLSVDSGIDGGDLYPMPNWFTGNNMANTNSSASSCSTSTGGCNGGGGMGECCGDFPLGGNYSPEMDGFPSQSQFQPSSVTPSLPQSFDFPFDANLIKQAAVMAAAAAAAANASKSAAQRPNDLGGTSLRSFIWPPPSWPSTADCSPSTETPAMHFRPDKYDNHQQKQQQQQQLALTSRFEAALRQQQQQQQSRQLYNRRKAESICFSSAARLNSGLLPSSNTNNGMKSHAGQLGSPPPHVDLCQQMSKSYANTPQKFARDIQQQQQQQQQQQRPVGCPFSKSSNGGIMGGGGGVGQRMGCSRGAGGSGRSKRTETTASFSSSSSTSSSETSDKPVIAKWRRACSFYLRGHCKKEDCEFAHDLTKVTCKFWEVGECFKGSTCPFLHGYPPELLLEVQQRQQQEQQQQQQQLEQFAGN
ncbi:hypothetical protein Aperf_G00000008983 [Anoplocephala perfoliata]